MFFGSPTYEALFMAENDDMGLENTYFWNVNNEYSRAYRGPNQGVKDDL